VSKMHHKTHQLVQTVCVIVDKTVRGKTTKSTFKASYLKEKSPGKLVHFKGFGAFPRPTCVVKKI
jgi:hypothetical protein